MNSPHHDDRLSRAAWAGDAAVRQQAQEDVEEQRGQVALVQRRLHQGNGAHGPVAAQLGRVEQQPGVDGQQVVEGQLAGWRRTDGCRVVKSEKDGRGVSPFQTEILKTIPHQKTPSEFDTQRSKAGN